MAEGWVLRVEAHPEESLGHYLGRFRRTNQVSHRIIAAHLGVPVQWVQAWEIPSRRRPPTAAQLVDLSQLVDVEPAHLMAMLPPVPLHLQTRLCAVCYRDVPVHRRQWQQAGIDECDRHHLALLSVCPVCGTCFRTPALWSDECCEQCGITFGAIQRYQQAIVVGRSP